MKYYFSKEIGEERCYTKAYILEFMKDNNITEMEIVEAEAEIGTGYFYCREFGEIGEVGEGCGNVCQRYTPRNGKSGRCRHSVNCYIQTENKLILKLNP